MGKRAKHVGLVILAQTGCLAVGLWMQHYCMDWSMRGAAAERAWNALDTGAKPLVSVLTDVGTRGLAFSTEAHERLEQIVRQFIPLDVGVLVTDGRWKVVFAGGMQGTAPEGLIAPGKHLAWTPVPDSRRPGGRGTHGHLEMPGGVHLAVAHALPRDDGYVVIHRRRAPVEAEVAALMRSLPAVSTLTLLWTSALLGISAYMILARYHDEVERERSRSLAEAMRQRQNLIRTRDAVIFGLAKLTESRDPETGDHLDRISVYSTTLASVLQRRPDFSHVVTPSFVRLIGISSALHDIGKVGVEDRILLKPGRLTAAERGLMQTHSNIGGDCLREIERRLGSSNFLQMAREIAFCHHERWDGSGYPNGLSGEGIPLPARIVAIADVYDALSSRRVYKEPLPHEECVEIIRQAAGSQFDPRIVETWLTIAGTFGEIAQRYADREPDAPRQEQAVTTTSRPVIAHGSEEDLVAAFSRQNDG